MRNLRMSLAIASLFALSSCASMTSTEKGTLGGAAIGGIAGSVISGGHPIGTIAGAAAGGIIGHEIGQDRDRRRGY
jgi:osmotically inducible lipoprotein OsmB